MSAAATITNTDSWSFYKRGDRYDWTASIPGKSLTGTEADQDTAKRAAQAALAELQAARS